MTRVNRGTESRKQFIDALEIFLGYANCCLYTKNALSVTEPNASFPAVKPFVYSLSFSPA